jgi:hypothetical protein
MVGPQVKKVTSAMRESIALRDAAVHRLASRSPPSIFDFGETNSPLLRPTVGGISRAAIVHAGGEGATIVRGRRLCAAGARPRLRA